jgi:pSer/pThr/pTyr-binding forkhead associated (FHA) protein
MPVSSGQTSTTTAALRAPEATFIVRNGRFAGTRRTIASTITVVGRDSKCDFRLDAEGVSPIHCIIASSGDSLHLRTLPDALAVIVNGAPVFDSILANGDLVEIGPFHFQIELIANSGTVASAETYPNPNALATEAERLEKQRSDLASKEKQLTVHLDERQRQLQILRDNAQEAHAALQSERQRYEVRVGEVLADLANSRSTLAQSQAELHARRERLRRLRMLLQRRYLRLSEAKEAQNQATLEDLARRENSLAEQKSRFERFRLHCNTNSELRRRQLDERSQELQQQEQALKTRESSLRADESKLDSTRSEFGLEYRRWEAGRKQRGQEIAGLEARIEAERRKLQTLRSEAEKHQGSLHNFQTAQLERSATALASLAGGASGTSLGGEQPSIDRLAADLADQRLWLAEQCQRLLRAQNQWREQHEDATAELEVVAQGLHERELRITAHERGLENAEADLRGRGQQIAQMRTSLESWKARLAIAASSWLGERERLLADLGARERLIEEHAAAAENAQARWKKRRQLHITRLREQRVAWYRLREFCVAAREEYWRRCQGLDKQARVLSERSLALEQLRQELIPQSGDLSTTENRLEVLRREWASLSEKAEQTVSAQWKALNREADQLDARARALFEQANKISTAEKNLSAKSEAREEFQAAASALELKHERETLFLRRQREALEMEVTTAREEVERLARLLIGEAEESSTLTNQAA